MYMQARYYDPVIGRFYSNDPVGFKNVHNFNRYAYANNNPYKYVDPDGRDPEELRRQIARANSGEFKHLIKIDTVEKGMSTLKMVSAVPALLGGPITAGFALTQAYDGAMELTSKPSETIKPIIQQSLESAKVNTELAAAVNGIVSLISGGNGLREGVKKIGNIFIGANKGSLTASVSSLALNQASLMYGLDSDLNSILDPVTNEDEKD